VRTYKRRKPRRRHFPRRQPQLTRALKWLFSISEGPIYIVPTRTWTQDERDKFIVRNHLTQIFQPTYDLDITRGILVREIPTFLKTGPDYEREHKLAAKQSQPSHSSREKTK